MSNRSSLLKLLAELDQQIAEVEDPTVEAPFGVSEPTHRAEIIDGLRAAVDNVEWQLALDLAESSRD